MKLATRLCSSHSTASLCLANGGLKRPSFTQSQFSSPSAFTFSSKSLSECIFCRKSNSGAGAAFTTPCSSCVARLYGVGRRCCAGKARTFSTLAWPSSSLAVASRCPRSLVLAVQIARSDTPQRSEEWFALRRDKLTTSTFSTALGFWKGTRRPELWSEKVFSRPDPTGPAKTPAMDWGVENEFAAIERYRSITGREVGSLGFAVHAEERYGWLGASPDGILSCFELGAGILEVKCPYNKGRPEKGLPWSKVPFYYMPQVQGQMEIMGREWLDLYCWTPNGSTVFRVGRDRGYWDLIHGILREFWWENVVPAKEALALGNKEEVEEEAIVEPFRPSSTHKLTGLAIFKSAKLASEAKLLCREIAGHVEYFGS